MILDGEYRPNILAIDRMIRHWVAGRAVPFELVRCELIVSEPFVAKIDKEQRGFLRIPPRRMHVEVRFDDLRHGSLLLRLPYCRHLPVYVDEREAAAELRLEARGTLLREIRGAHLEAVTVTQKLSGGAPLTAAAGIDLGAVSLETLTAEELAELEAATAARMTHGR